MSSHFERKTEEILSKRNKYNKKRKKVINAISFSVLPVILLVGLFLIFPPDIASNAEPPEYFYTSIEIEATSSEGCAEFQFSYLIAEEIMKFINEKCVNHSNDNNGSSAGGSSDSFFTDNTDYLIYATDKNGNVSIYCVTRNYILSSKYGAVPISGSDYFKFQNILTS